MKKIAPILLVLIFLGCKEDSPQGTETGNVELYINHLANNQPLRMDSIKYNIPSGYNMSITRWEHYLSGITFYNEDNIVYESKEGFYLNGRYPDTWSILLTNVPTGKITSIKVVLGLTEELNITGALPNSAENIGMAWPDVMGGGYHFMKLEGHFEKSPPSAGYAMHLGENGYQVVKTIPIEFNVSKSADLKIQVDMDAMEWFYNPYDFDFEIDGNYTMGIPALMEKLMDNGSTVITKTEVK